MGWLKLGTQVAPSRPVGIEEDLKLTTQHIESVSLVPEEKAESDTYSAASLDLPSERLPFISPEVVRKKNSIENGRLFIVVDRIVYDCTDFLREHPGGAQIIKSFGGQECSWQFWRFHGKKELEEFGRRLRVGKTDGMVNRFKEPKKYVGLRNLAADEWD